MCPHRSRFGVGEEGLETRGSVQVETQILKLVEADAEVVSGGDGVILGMAL